VTPGRWRPWLLVPLAFALACPEREDPPGPDGVRVPAPLGPAISVEERRRLREALPEKEARRRERVEVLLADADPARRVEGVALMRSDEEDESLRLVALLHSDPSPAVRAEAAARLDLAEPELALEPLLDALEDPAPGVVVASLRTIEMIGDAGVVPRLRPYQHHPEGIVRRAVASAIDTLE